MFLAIYVVAGGRLGGRGAGLSVSSGRIIAWRCVAAVWRMKLVARRHRSAVIMASVSIVW